MDIASTPIENLVVVTPKRHGDARGFFAETWNTATLAERGFDWTFVQDNQSLSEAKGTLRGLHYQAPPYAQAKLVRCGRGAVWDVAVDVRPGSATYAQWFGIELSADNGKQLYIPEGFLHGFSTLTEGAELLYKCSAAYDAQAEGAVRWDSSALAIDWKLEAAPVLSDKDRAAPDFGDWTNPF